MNNIDLLDPLLFFRPAMKAWLRAYLTWIIDSGKTPYIVVNPHGKGVEMPDIAIKGEEVVVLDMSPTAINNLHYADDFISFVTTFSGQRHNLHIPYEYIALVYVPGTKVRFLNPFPSYQEGVGIKRDGSEPVEKAETPSNVVYLKGRTKK